MSEEGRLEELLEKLPPGLAEAVRGGFSPSYKKRLKRWYLQKRVGRKIESHLVPKEHDDIMREIHELKKRAKRAEKSEEHELKIREAVKRPGKPIVEKEIEDAAWFHNLLHDLGKYAYHRMVKYVDWGAEEVKDQEKAYETLSLFLEDLMKLREDVPMLRQLEERLVGYEIYTQILEQRLRKLEELYVTLASVADEETRRRGLTVLALRAMGAS